MSSPIPSTAVTSQTPRATRASTFKKYYLEAAVDLLGTSGLRSLTHARVDARAGLPPGSTSNYFRTREALLAGVVEHMVTTEAPVVDASVLPRTAEELATELTRLFDFLTGQNKTMTTARMVLLMEASHDENLRAADGIWAVGDITGKGAFTHVATYQARIVVDDILGRDHEPADYSAVPRVTFTDPEVASVGISEAQAREKGMNVKTGVAKTASSARGWIHGPGAEHGVIKLVIDDDRNVIVGASVMGPAAGEVIGLLLLAINESIPVERLRRLIFPYPTFVRGIEDALNDLS